MLLVNWQPVLPDTYPDVLDGNGSNGEARLGQSYSRDSMPSICNIRSVPNGGRRMKAWGFSNGTPIHDLDVQKPTFSPMQEWAWDKHVMQGKKVNANVEAAPTTRIMEPRKKILALWSLLNNLTDEASQRCVALRNKVDDIDDMV
eukprot:Gb_39574 [translate_table: standard]